MIRSLNFTVGRQIFGFSKLPRSSRCPSYPYCSKTPTYSRRGPFVEVQHPAKARPAINALGLRLPNEYRGDQLITVLNSNPHDDMFNVNRRARSDVRQYRVRT